MRDARAILIEARRLIAEGDFTQHAAARDERGRPVRAFSLKARAYCLAGALIAARANLTAALLKRDEREVLARVLGFEDRHALRRWNDALNRRQRDVLAVLDDAIARLA